MKTYTPEELKTIIENHKHWLKEDCEGWRDMKANLRGADLRGAYLRGADLGGAYLRGADLRGADLRGADLGGAYLRGADLRGANLRGADLRGADLGGADLRGAYLRGAYLRGADLGGAYLRGADLRGAYLRGADLGGAYLRGADLRGANLRGADLRGAKELDNVLYNENTSFFAIQCPESGAFEAYKKAIRTVGGAAIVHLLVPSTAKRSSATSRKCRVSEAQVLDITSIDGKEELTEAMSQHDNTYVYRKGETVKVDNFCDDRWTECAAGIHCFITRREAVNY